MGMLVVWVIFVMSPSSVLKLNLLLTVQIAEVIDDRPEEVKQMEVFRTSNRWKVIGGK